MSHTFLHEPTGVRFHYNGDHSGTTLVICPDGAEYRIPGKALAAFGWSVSSEAMVSALEDMSDPWGDSSV